MKPTNLPEWKVFLETNGKTPMYAIAFKQHLPIIHEGKKYLIDEMCTEGIILVELDPKIEKMLAERRERIQSKQRITPKTVDKSDSFYCEGHKRIESKRKDGKIFGRRTILEPYKYYCRKFVKAHNVQPLPDSRSSILNEQRERRKRLDRLMNEGED